MELYTETMFSNMQSLPTISTLLGEGHSNYGDSVIVLIRLHEQSTAQDTLNLS